MTTALAKEELIGPKTLGQLARDSLAEVDGNVTKATSRLASLLRSDKTLLESIVQAAIADAVKERVGSAHRTMRAMVISRSTRASVEALAEGFVGCFMEFPLMGGIKLRDATRILVEDQAEFYRKSHMDMGHKWRWLRLIAQATPPDKTVGDVLTEDRVGELWKETDKQSTAE